LNASKQRAGKGPAYQISTGVRQEKCRGKRDPTERVTGDRLKPPITTGSVAKFRLYRGVGTGKGGRPAGNGQLRDKTIKVEKKGTEKRIINPLQGHRSI